jgi:hypothetical protein
MQKKAFMISYLQAAVRAAFDCRLPFPSNRRATGSVVGVLLAKTSGSDIII